MAAKRKAKSSTRRTGARKPTRTAPRRGHGGAARAVGRVRKGSPRAGRNGRSFGQLVRELRLDAGYGLRELCEQVGMSPAYLSMVERDELAPPAPGKVLALAECLGQDQDELLALAGRLPEDLLPLIQRHPREVADLIRATRRLGQEGIRRLAERARKLGG